MSLQKRVKTDMVSAMKSGEKDKVALLKVLMGELSRNDFYTVKKNKSDIQLPDELAVKEIRKMSENAKLMGAKYNSDDEKGKLMCDKYEFEADVLSGYLPTMINPADTEVIVKNIIAIYDFDSIKQMGQIMGKVKQCKEASQIDMKTVNIIIKKLLTK